MKIKVTVHNVTENEIAAIMAKHGWNAYGIESMIADLAEWFPEGLSRKTLLEVLADYEDDTSVIMQDYA